MAVTVIGVFDNATEAQEAVNNLVNAGFSRNSIDVSTATEGAYASGQTTTTGLNTSGDVIPDRHRNTSGTAVEEVGDDLKDTGSSIGNFFSSLFGGGDDADRYTTVADRSSVVTVHAQTDEEAERAADVLDDSGAVDVNERAAQYGHGSTGTTGTYAAGAAATGMAAGMMDDKTTPRTDMTGDQTLKVIEEKMEVGKRMEETGGVRLRSRIVERPVEEHLRLREERVSVNRNPVNRPASAADLDAFKEGQVEMTERTERAVVNKTANVVEEISIGKEVTERDEVIRDTVRKTEVDVEQLGKTDTTRTGRTGLDSDDVTYSTK